MGSKPESKEHRVIVQPSLVVTDLIVVPSLAASSNGGLCCGCGHRSSGAVYACPACGRSGSFVELGADWADHGLR